MMYAGFILIFAALELLIMIIEAAAYSVIMRKERLWKRIVYAVTANVASAVIGGFLLTIVDPYI